jgi:hypothetical protein
MVEICDGLENFLPDISNIKDPGNYSQMEKEKLASLMQDDEFESEQVPRTISICTIYKEPMYKRHLPH